MSRPTAEFLTGLGVLLIVMLVSFPGAPAAVSVAARCLLLAGLLGLVFGGQTEQLRDDVTRPR